MKQAVLSKGNVIPRDVPMPNNGHKSVLVKVEYTCISAGTEMNSVRNSQKNLLELALEKPRQAKDGLIMLKERGITALSGAIKRATGASFGNALGYSGSGEIVSIGSGITGFAIGQRVAVAGVGYANHAGYASVPINLVIPIPDKVTLPEAAPIAVGSIAMQGVRVLAPKPDETIIVMGMGLIGLLTVQMLIVAGCRVIGIDINGKRLAFAQKNYGIEIINSTIDNAETACMILTQGRGADGVLFTAATTSSKPMSDCFKILRRKGRFVLVGSSGMKINREDIYKKELEFKISCSYGPGRYDSNYEEGGIDYPYSQVRWTEKRNMSYFLSLIEADKLDIKSMIGGIFPVEDSAQAYKLLERPDAPLITLLSYADSHENISDSTDTVFFNRNKHIKKTKTAISYGVIGAGSFVRSMHLPNLAKYPDKYYLKAVMSRTGYSAASVAAQFNAEYATTNLERILNDDEIELVVICTRHDLHASIAIKALQAGKHVFVEKPSAINKNQLDELLAVIKKSGKAYLTGYNRRFSKYIREVACKVKHRKGTLLLEYTMNAGYIPKDHWVHSLEGGGRIVGEGCHIVDLLGFIAGFDVDSISVSHLFHKSDYYTSDDNVSVIIKYSDNSIAIMNYIANGSSKYPKETLRAYYDGKIITMSDYMSLKGEGVRVKRLRSSAPQKGQEEEMLNFYEHIKKGSLYPISLDEIKQTAYVTFQIKEAAKNAYSRTQREGGDA
jgi:predicted dehydrogenase/threonine dehydrogenase-like Zn-dependent dehydrogenase